MPAFPTPFWIAVVVTVGAGLWFWRKRQTGFGLPAMAVLGTVAVWYFGDAFYNDYDSMVNQFGAEVLATAWWQVVLFLVGFSVMVPQVHRAFNRRWRQRSSEVLRFATGREIENPVFQRGIDRFLVALIIAWVPLMGVALVRTDFDFAGLFLPWLGRKAEPWSRERVGGGLDALLSLSGYVQVFMTASFGIIAAVSRNPRTKLIALGICAITMPFYLLDRTRNTMLSTVVPGLLAWVFLGMRGHIVVRFAILGAAFLFLESWFSFVMESRGEGKNVAASFAEGREGEDEEETEEEEETEDKESQSKHRGLNMFEELAWITTFIEVGNYTPNYGQRYFAELVNPVPRSLWPDKPLVGIDYAKARGFGGGSAAGAGVVASVSTGMIGQGVTNFGRLFGPLASALLMAFWVALLARQDLRARGEPARLLLYGLGLVLTFNLGRDVTLLVLYPYLFGSLLFWWWSRHGRTPARRSPAGGPNLPPITATASPGVAASTPVSKGRREETREERQRRRRRLRPIEFDDELGEPPPPRSVPEPEAQPEPPAPPRIVPPTPKPMAPPPGHFDDEPEAR